MHLPQPGSLLALRRYSGLTQDQRGPQAGARRPGSRWHQPPPSPLQALINARVDADLELVGGFIAQVEAKKASLPA